MTTRLDVVRAESQKLRFLSISLGLKIEIDVGPFNQRVGLKVRLEDPKDGGNPLLAIKDVVDWIVWISLGECEWTKLTLEAKFLSGAPEEQGTERVALIDTVH